VARAAALADKKLEELEEVFEAKKERIIFLNHRHLHGQDESVNL
jgi:hypothetical protein